MVKSNNNMGQVSMAQIQQQMTQVAKKDSKGVEEAFKHIEGREKPAAELKQAQADFKQVDSFAPGKTGGEFGHLTKKIGDETNRIGQLKGELAGLHKNLKKSEANSLGDRIRRAFGGSAPRDEHKIKADKKEIAHKQAWLAKVEGHLQKHTEKLNLLTQKDKLEHKEAKIEAKLEKM